MKTGKVVALEVTYYCNTGNSMDLSLSVRVFNVFERNEISLNLTLLRNTCVMSVVSLSIIAYVQLLITIRSQTLAYLWFKIYFRKDRFDITKHALLFLKILERALFHMENCYNIPHIHGTGYMCRTNLPSNTAFRGFGGPQGMMVAESWICDVAMACGLPAEEVSNDNNVLCD